MFIAPWIIGFFLFTLIPMVATFIFTFTDINLANAGNIQFVGLQNYAQLLTDHQTHASLLVTFKFALIALPGLHAPAVLRGDARQLAPPHGHVRVPRPVLPARTSCRSWPAS